MHVAALIGSRVVGPASSQNGPANVICVYDRIAVAGPGAVGPTPIRLVIVSVPPSTNAARASGGTGGGPAAPTTPSTGASQ